MVIEGPPFQLTLHVTAGHRSAGTRDAEPPCHCQLRECHDRSPEPYKRLPDLYQQQYHSHLD